MNDIPPVFTTVPRPITLDDDVPIGTTVIDLVAADSDGTAPGNQVSVFLPEGISSFLPRRITKKEIFIELGTHRFDMRSLVAVSPASTS